MRFNIGDRVRFLDEKGEGTIKFFKDNLTAIVEIEEGFPIPYPVNKLVPVVEEGAASSVMTSAPGKVIVHKEKGPAQSKSSKQYKKRGDIVEEVDLHIDQLIDYKKRLTNAEIIQIQLNHFQYRLDKAMLNNTGKIIFIHGVGEGVLKAEIRKILDGYSNVTYHDASYRKYGFGATEVTIK